MKKRFIVEIDVPEDSGDLCWDSDPTGSQAFHDCIMAALPEVSLSWLVRSVDSSDEFQEFIKRKNTVRSSCKLISPVK